MINLTAKTDDTIFNSKLYIGTRERFQILIIMFNIFLEFSASVLRQEKSIQVIKIRNDAMVIIFMNKIKIIFYISNPTESTGIYYDSSTLVFRKKINVEVLEHSCLPILTM